MASPARINFNFGANSIGGGGGALEEKEPSCTPPSKPKIFSKGVFYEKLNNSQKKQIVWMETEKIKEKFLLLVDFKKKKIGKWTSMIFY